MKSALLVSLAALALCGAAAPASATVLTYSFSGTIVSGYDGQDLFTGGDLSGLPYTVTETFENAVLQGMPSTVSELYFSFPPSIVDVSITVDGQTSPGGTNGFGSVNVGSGGLATTLLQGTTYSLLFNVTSPKIVSPTTSFSANASNASITGSFTFGPFGPPGTPDDGITTIDFGNGTVSAVPLPAALPMFSIALLGLGAVGYGLQRNRKAALPA